MTNLKSNKVYKALKNKVTNGEKMPSVKDIHSLLVELGIQHCFDGEVINMVERRSGGNRYVNSRHEGKTGKRISFRAFVKDGKKSPFVSTLTGKPKNSEWVDLNSSDSYYSVNSWGHAHRLLLVLDNYKNMTFVAER